MTQLHAAHARDTEHRPFLAESGGAVGRVAAFLYGLLAYAVFFAAFLYAVGFVGNLVVPKTIDTGASVSITEALIVNLLLLSVFAVQHSVMARRQFKQWWTQYRTEIGRAQHLRVFR